MALLNPLFGCPAVEQVFTDRNTVQRMLDFEAALTRAEGRTGVIPASAVTPICAQCHADMFDLGYLSNAGARAGHIAMPVINELSAKDSASNGDAAAFVHWGD